MFVRELTPDTLSEAANFIGVHEERSIALMSHLTDGINLHMPDKQFTYYLYRYSRTEPVVAVVCLSENGLVLHHIGDAVFADEELRLAVERDLQGALRQIPLYCILGESRGGELIRKCTRKKPRASIDYQLMIWQESSVQTSDAANASSSISSGVSEIRQISASSPLPGYTLTHCNEDDTEALLPLQKQYDKIEVLQPGDSFNEDFCRFSLRKNLRTQHIIGLKADNVIPADAATSKKATSSSVELFAAKAGTNAIGRQWWQIGGVFTQPEFRNRGCAAFMVEELARMAKAEGKQTALFVKTANLSAKAAYTKAHFTPLGPFEIIYY